MDSTQLPVFKLPQKANHVQDKRFENTAAGKKRHHDSTYQNAFKKVLRHSLGTSRTELNKELLKTLAKQKSKNPESPSEKPVLDKNGRAIESLRCIFETSVLRKIGCQPCDDFFNRNSNERHNKADAIEQLCRKLFQDHKILPTEVECPNCKQNCRYILYRKLWQCSKKVNNLKCNFSYSEKTIPLFKDCQMLYDKALMLCCKFTSLDFKSIKKGRSFEKFYDNCSEVCKKGLLKEKIGGQGKTVEISDVLLESGHWMFLGIERETGKFFILPTAGSLAQVSRSICLKFNILGSILPGSNLAISRLQQEYTKLKNDVEITSKYSIVEQNSLQACDGFFNELQVELEKVDLKDSFMKNFAFWYMFRKKYPHNTLHEFLVSCALQ